MKQHFNCPTEKIACFSGAMFILSLALFLYFLASAYFMIAVPSEDNPLIPCSYFAQTSCSDLVMSMTWGSLTIGVVTLILSLLTIPSPYKNKKSNNGLEGSPDYGE